MRQMNAVEKYEASLLAKLAAYLPEGLGRNDRRRIQRQFLDDVRGRRCKRKLTLKTRWFYVHRVLRCLGLKRIAYRLFLTPRITVKYMGLFAPVPEFILYDFEHISSKPLVVFAPADMPIPQGFRQAGSALPTATALPAEALRAGVATTTANSTPS